MGSKGLLLFLIALFVVFYLMISGIEQIVTFRSVVHTVAYCPDLPTCLPLRRTFFYLNRLI